ncbi:MAG TPA: hypothetical protein VK087_02430 [Tissierellaceae bacterium]|nr:hypothetical protein [Tissierellaceae bacterium]
MKKITSLPLNPTVPFSPSAVDYKNFGGHAVVTSYNGWRLETNSWKKSCYISANLPGLMSMHTVKGPDAVKLLNENFVNNFTNVPVGAGRHGIMVTKKGNIIEHGLVLRLGEDEFGTYAFQPYINFLANSGRYRVEPIETSIRDYVYQIAGPRSLEVIENAAQQDLHDLKFMRFCNAEIAGHRVRVIRMGMGGTLAYEVHGPLEDSHDVYNKIVEAGSNYGIEKLGWLAYQCNHTENGFPQIGQHFPYPFDEEPEFLEYQKNHGFIFDPLSFPVLGSLSDNIHDYYRNPFELGWGHMVKFDHDFNGKDALEKIANSNHREIVTLVWNKEDIIDIFASNFNNEEKPYKQFVFPFDQNANSFGNSQDKVLNSQGEIVGASMQPIFTDYYKDVISLCVINPEYLDIGTELTVVWGNKDDRMKNIRSTVARYPYLDLTNNVDYNTDSIPRLSK